MTKIPSITTTKWSVFERIGFRFSFIYLMLYVIIQNNGAFPFWQKLMGWSTNLLHEFIPWVGKHILHLSYDITTFTGGSGDTTYDYVIVFVIFVIAVFGAIIWSILDRRRTSYKKMYYWLTVAVRFYVALMLINYGFVKVIKLQFPSPGFYRLLENYGDSSPMGLAWTFLGFSKGYNLFMGLAELMAGLLLFRRTMTIGAIITLMAATNVMAVNYFYDVPVKLLSTHLVLMTLFLLSRDFKKLFAFFFTGQAVSLSAIEQPKRKNNKSLKLGSRIFKTVLIGYIFIFGFMNVKKSEATYGSKAPKPAFYGLYKITHFEKNNDTIAPDVTNYDRWRYLVMEREGSAQIYTMGKTRLYYQAIVDTLKSEITLVNFQDETDEFVIHLKTTDSTFSFETLYKNDSIKASGRILKKENFLLMNRGFNWISEYPYNR